MNKTILKMSALMLPILLGGCKTSTGEEDEIIGQPQVEIKDGMITPEVLEALGRINEMIPSEDGKTIAFTLAYESIEKNKSNAEIYRINSDGSDLKQLTETAGSEGNLRWLEDGKKLAYIGVDPETKTTQIYSINIDGSEIKKLSNVENGVDCFEFSPDGKMVVYGSNIKPYNENNEALFKDLDKTTGRVVNDLMFKHWDEWVTEIPHPFIASFDGVAVGEGIDIMKDEPFECPMKPFGGAESFAWSPDSQQLVYCSRKASGKDYAFSTNSDLYLYDIDKKTTVNLTEGNPGYDTDPKFSRDGKQLAWLSMKTAGYESDKKRLMVMDMSTKSKRDLTENLDRWPEGFAWSPSGKKIIFNGYDGGVMPIFSIDVNSCAVDTVAKGQWDYVNVCPVDESKVLAMRHSMSRPNEICVATVGETRDITTVNKDLLSKLKLGKVEKHLVPTNDGKEMTAWVILPPDFDPNKKYPALLYCQGGPQQAVSQFWSYRWNFMIMAAHGYVVIAPNRRGVPGFGEEWNAQISGDYGGQNMKDYLAATDYIASQPYVDKDHIGAIGASYGGFSVYWLAGHHEGRFAALIAHAGIFNLESQYLETEEMFFVHHDFGGAYWDKSNATAQTTYANSPHLYVDKWTAPLLVTVGEKDYRILASQGMQAFAAAKMHGLECEMLVFPDENHWVIKPQNAILWQRVFFNFLDKYLRPDITPRYGKESVSVSADASK
ncbi:MAG: S9 family peptidase [Prevotella sp.]|nr:S9 family peptidase [Bacteroides sp.]MCM1365884.1 S9 family peptidase [Prevotella sp.]